MSQLRGVAGDLGSNVSLSRAKQQVESAAKQLASSYYPGPLAPGSFSASTASLALSVVLPLPA